MARTLLLLPRMKLVVSIVLVAGCGTSSPSTPDGARASDAAVTSDASPDASTLPTGAWTSIHNVVPAVSDFVGCNRESLTQDLLTMYATCGQTSPGGWDIDVLTRATTSDPWGAPTKIAELSTNICYDGGGTISPDELTIWLTLETGSGCNNDDIRISTRASRSDAWGAPTPVAALDTIDPELSPHVIASGLAMTFERNYLVYSSTRPSTTATWSPPTALGLPAPYYAVMDSMLSADQLQLVLINRDNPCNTEPCNHAYVATRARATDPFGPPAPIPEINAVGSIDSLWLSADGHTLYFAVEVRPGTPGSAHDIYEATR